MLLMEFSEKSLSFDVFIIPGTFNSLSTANVNERMLQFIVFSSHYNILLFINPGLDYRSKKTNQDFNCNNWNLYYNFNILFMIYNYNSKILYLNYKYLLKPGL